MTTQRLATASAVLLGFSGLALLFLADVILPQLAPGLPVTSSWIGQLLGGAWLGLAWATWLTRGTPQGGIYGRPIVMANAWMYFITAMVLVRAAARSSAFLWVVTAIAILMAAGYGLTLFRGPTERGRNN